MQNTLHRAQIAMLVASIITAPAAAYAQDISAFANKSMQNASVNDPFSHDFIHTPPSRPHGSNRVHVNDPFSHDFVHTPPSGPTGFDRASAATIPAQSGNGIGGLLIGGLAIGLAAALAAGGGSDGSDDGSRPPVQDPPVYNPPVKPPESDNDQAPFETLEYLRNYGLKMINAAARYADGGTGAGVLLAVMDSGADITHINLAPNIAQDLSYSYYTGNNDIRDFEGHGTHVASIIAGAKNDRGSHGVAFDARLMILQGLDRGDGSKALQSTLHIWADAQRRAIAAGARAINHSWGITDTDGTSRMINGFNRTSLGNYLGSDMTKALDESSASGLITVVAAGNDGRDQVAVNAGVPLYFPEFQDHWLAVVAVGSDGLIASYSNRCGDARAFCLAAPGSFILAAASSDVLDYGPESFILKSGTSMAAPHVTGAVGVLASNFPELTGREIARILLDTAKDIGAAGVDAIYGHGLLDLSNAVAPQGTLTLKTAHSISDGETGINGSHIISQGTVGQALKATLTGQVVMVTDAYDRAYHSDVGDFVALGSQASQMSARVSAFTLDSSADRTGSIDTQAFGTSYADMVDGVPVSQSADFGRTKITVDSVFGDFATYAAAGVSTTFGSHTLTLGMGNLNENGAMLGADISGGLGGNMRSQTRFTRVGADLALGQSSSLQIAAAQGTTSFASGGILAAGRDISTTSVSMGLAQQGFMQRGDRFSVGVSRPLSITGGVVTLDTPVGIAAATEDGRGTEVLRATYDIDMAYADPGADITMGYDVPLGGGYMAFGGVWTPSSGGAGDMAVSIGWSRVF